MFDSFIVQLVYVERLDIFSNLHSLCLSSDIFSIITNISLTLSSVVLARYPVPSRTGRESLGEAIFKGEAGKGGTSTSVLSLVRVSKTGGKQQDWVVDTRDKIKPETLVNGKHVSFQQDMTLGQLWLRTNWLRFNEYRNIQRSTGSRRHEKKGVMTNDVIWSTSGSGDTWKTWQKKYNTSMSETNSCSMTSMSRDQIVLKSETGLPSYVMMTSNVFLRT